MARPKTINTALAEFNVEALRRFRQRQVAEPDWIPNEAQARVLKILAETQVIMQRRKPESSDGQAGDDAGPAMTIEELERQTASTPEPKAEDASDDA